MSDLHLSDSGAQYRDGTIDCTRTMHFGRPTPDQCEAYTRVLQGHIAIDSAIFPEGTSGRQLDVLARNALWKEGLNYLVSIHTLHLKRNCSRFRLLSMGQVMASDRI